MKVRIEMTVEVDPERWRQEYGDLSPVVSVRQHVRDLAVNTIDGWLYEVGVQPEPTNSEAAQ